MKTALLTHPLFERHETPTGHPECPQRVTAILDQLRAEQIYDLLAIFEPPAATRDQLARVHDPAYLEELDALDASDGLVAIDPDTWAGPHTLAAAKHAAGAAVLATDLVLGGEVGDAFCCVRPPGHHAERDKAMGFSFFNNVAVGAAHALDAHGLERVAILDFDVHHGNGTEHIFAGDDRVLFCSSFQHPFYPYSGADSGADNVVAVPLPAGTEGATFRAALEDAWGAAVERFRPQMIFVSAGFDGHAADPLAQLRLDDDDYRWVSEWIIGLAEQHAEGRIVSTLEGGYSLADLARAATLHVRSLLRV